MVKRLHITGSVVLGALTFADPSNNHAASIKIAAASSVEMQADMSLDFDHVKKDGDPQEDKKPSLYSYESTTTVEIEQHVDDSVDNEHENTLPASLAKVVLVGAQRRSQAAQATEEGIVSSEELSSPDANSEGDTVTNSKPPLTGCVWGSAGCNKSKSKWNTGTNSGSSINSSSADEIVKNESDAPSSASVFTGSASAKIKAHVQEALGGVPPVRRSMRSTSNDAEKGKNDDSSHKPPQGFQLSARIVTSPSDGLAYFLDVPEDMNALELHNWMMNIPYTYVECGPTVESTTESFLLENMVVRHFPHGADQGHWVNLAGGVTLEKPNADIGNSGSEEETYISDDIDGHPKLLVALSPTEITVSGNDEETRTFYPGEVVLMEDTLGKGHKMRAARGTSDTSSVFGQDLKVLIVSLPHSVHYTTADLNDYARHQKTNASQRNKMQPDAPSDPPSPSSYSGAKHSIFGLMPRHHSRDRIFKDYRAASFAAHDTKPCPLEYDSAYSSLFTPTYQQRKGRRRRRIHHNRKESAFSSDYPPPPGHSTYDEESALFTFLPSLRRTMLFGVGLSLTSSFVYCVQLLYPPLLALIGGAAFVMGGALMNVLGARWSYRQWMAVWEEEWRWRREMKKHKDAQGEREEASMMQDGNETFGETNNEAEHQYATTHDSVNSVEE